MPIIIVRGNLTSYSHSKEKYRVMVSGLKPADIEAFSSRFACGGYTDEQTIVYIAHPCIILTALEVSYEFKSFNCVVQVLGYRVVASSSTSVKQDFHEYCWTMRKEFSEPEPVEEPVARIDVPE